MNLRTITVAAVALLAGGLYIAHHVDDRRLDAAATQSSTSLRGPITMLPEVLVRAARPGQVVSNEVVASDREMEDAYLPACAEIEALYRDAERPNRRDESPTRPCHGPILLSAVEVRGARPRVADLAAIERRTVPGQIVRGSDRSSTDGAVFGGMATSAERTSAPDMPFFDFSGALR